MKHYQKNNGFTLIELLVVVLIIGILSAIALPQYRLAVMKARFSTMMPIVKAMKDAQEVFYMNNGKYAESFEELNFEIGGGVQASDKPSAMYVKDFVCYLHASGFVYCSGENSGYYAHFLQHSEHSNQVFCATRSNSDKEGIKLREKLCKSYGGEKVFDVGSEWSFYSMP